LDLKDVRSTDEPETVLEKVTGEVTDLREQVETQKDEIADLQAAAKDGEAYRDARVEEAIKQGVRAYGDDFDEEYHREYYGDMPLEKLEDHIAQNKKKGDAALAAGRSTTDEHEPPPERNKRTPRQRKRRWR
jgi:ATP-dependent exoDNAse (exonuclease V) alpha subunit